MAESSLSLGYPDILLAIGDYLGWTSTSGSWTAEELALAERIMASGLRQFYFPPALPNQPHHKWNFMWPVTTLSTVAEQADYDLPDDFGAANGDWTYAPNVTYQPLRVTGEARIRTLRQQTTAQRRPEMVAVRAKASAGTTGQRFEAMLWPTPNAVYVLTYRYQALPSKLSAANPYPLGGVAHAETILASCLAAAEMQEEQQHGAQWQSFMERLSASIREDQRQAPEVLGSYGRGGDDGRRWVRAPSATTYNGV